MSSRKTNEENVQSVNPAMFLATTYDKASEAWTRFSPNLMVSLIGVFFKNVHFL